MISMIDPVFYVQISFPRKLVQIPPIPYTNHEKVGKFDNLYIQIEMVKCGQN